MSRDVAKLIYDMSCKDDDLVTSLKRLYKRKNILLRVYDIVKTNIKKGAITSILLNYEYDIPGSVIINYTRYSGTDPFAKNEIPDFKYAFVEGCDVIVVNDESTRILINDVIIPLDLRWCGKRLYCQNSLSLKYQVWVSWDHW